jgi:hypothetical protein
MELLGEYGRSVNEAFEQVQGYSDNLAKTTGTFTVNPDNVLAAAKIIHTLAANLNDELVDARDSLEIAPPGDDDVSVRVAPAWNDVLVRRPDSYANRIQQYVDGLTNLAEQCKNSAKAYGYTDQQIAGALTGVRSA